MLPPYELMSLNTTEQVDILAMITSESLVKNAMIQLKKKENTTSLLNLHVNIKLKKVVSDVLRSDKRTKNTQNNVTKYIKTCKANIPPRNSRSEALVMSSSEKWKKWVMLADIQTNHGPTQSIILASGGEMKRMEGDASPRALMDLTNQQLSGKQTSGGGTVRPGRGIQVNLRELAVVRASVANPSPSPLTVDALHAIIMHFYKTRRGRDTPFKRYPLE
ncbi:hypothetical protein LOAG_02472 [Loa loa]|uniref:Uncharacterized protein n=1 Tax=Loa loa TaxID=7209 RepID=A0A1S0U6J3_LOALO|nr:hypothetical protein LOAG_02472 [Loa loa]EFO26013.1 hypothetical protein LOAG_02472 [Loa loa]